MEPRHSYRGGPVWFFDYVDIAFVTLFSPLTGLGKTSECDQLTCRHIIAHADESAMNNRWNQWNEETYLGLKRELRTGSLLAPVLRTTPPGSSRAPSPACRPGRWRAPSPRAARRRFSR